MRKGPLYTFVFAGIICVFCALILAEAATSLKARQEANVQLDVVVNILGAVGHDVAALKKRPANEIFDLYKQEFKEQLLDKENQSTTTDFMKEQLESLGYPKEDIEKLPTGALLTKFKDKMPMLAGKNGKSVEAYDPGYKVVYIHMQNNQPDAYVIPIQGFGLWDIVKGYLALETDLNTVKGVTFYEHKETPGLGAQVTEQWFQNNWKGKKILDESGALVSITVAKGDTAQGEHQVDGISGSTLTGNGVNSFLMNDLKRYEPFFKTLRGTQGAPE